MKILRLVIIFLCLLFFGNLNSFAEMTSDEALSEFVAAGIAYKEGRYDGAIKRYNKILEGNWVSGPLYYNLGNSYFKRKNVGHAVLNYHRAKKYIPRDSDLNYNDRYVRNKIEQQDIGSGQSFFDRAYRTHIQSYTIDELVMILFCIILLSGILFLISLSVHWPRSATGGIIIVLILSLFVYSASLIAKVRIEHNIAIVMTETDAFFEPRTDSTVHFTLSEGIQARILKTQGTWVKIERLDGKIGWVDRDVLEII